MTTRCAQPAATATLPGSAAPPALAALTAAALTSAGHHVTGPDDAGRLLIAARLAQCVVIVTDNADAELHWTPHAGQHGDPHATAAMAAALLDGRPCPRHPDAKAGKDITPKGIAGMDLRAGGYTVALTVHTDDYYYDVTAEITVTSPRAPGTAYLTDQGGLTWHRDYSRDHAAETWEPAYRAWLPDPPAAARAIADTITRALPPGQGRAEQVCALCGLSLSWCRCLRSHPAQPAPAA